VTIARRQVVVGVVAALAAPALAHLPVAAGGGAKPPLIAAASSLKGLLDAWAATLAVGNRPRLVFGATANLVRQIEQGAPYELLLAADEASVQRLADRGLTLAPPVVFALGQLSLIVPAASPLDITGGLSGLQVARISRFAIANPDLAPYGRAAVQALQAAGLGDAVRGKLMLAENVALAAAFVAMGGADAGLVASATLKLSGLALRVRAIPVSPDQHAAIRHAAAALRGAGPAATAMLAQFVSPAQHVMLAEQGFAVP
jgi:molybdate transport system substrate-binding protein